MKRNNERDSLDALLADAAKFAGQKDLEIYAEPMEDAAFSPDFVWRAQEIYASRKRARVRRTMARWARIAAVFAFSLLLLRLFAPSDVTAGEYKLEDFTIEWRGDYLTIGYKVPEAEDPLYLTEILDYRYPTYAPDGYWEDDSPRDSDTWSVQWYWRGDQRIEYIQSLRRPPTLVSGGPEFLRQNTRISEVMVNGEPACAVERIGQEGVWSCIFWRDYLYEYSLAGETSVEELIRMAQSVK